MRRKFVDKNNIFRILLLYFNNNNNDNNDLCLSEVKYDSHSKQLTKR